MKKIILMVIAMVMTLTSIDVVAAPKQKQKKTETQLEKVEFVVNITCDKCEKKVMSFIPNQKGVKDVNVDMKKKVVTVTYTKGKTTPSALVSAFAKIDLKAKEVGTSEPNRR